MKLAATELILALQATTAMVDAQVKYKMTTDIPPSITTPDSVETSLGTLRFFDGFPDPETARKVYDNLDLILFGFAYTLPSGKTLKRQLSFTRRANGN